MKLETFYDAIEFAESLTDLDDVKTQALLLLVKELKWQWADKAKEYVIPT